MPLFKACLNFELSPHAWVEGSEAPKNTAEFNETETDSKIQEGRSTI